MVCRADDTLRSCVRFVIRTNGVPRSLFKVLAIQATNNLSDERAEFLINDRLFREKLTKAGVIKTLFDRFDATLRASGYIAMSGQIVDASLIAVPRATPACFASRVGVKADNALNSNRTTQWGPIRRLPVKQFIPTSAFHRSMHFRLD